MISADDRPIGQTVRAVREALGISVMRLASMASKESGPHTSQLGGSHIEAFEAGGVLSARDFAAIRDALEGALHLALENPPVAGGGR